MAEHVAMMRRRGYKYTSQPVRLLQFDRFLQLNPHLETEPLSVMIDRWAATKGTRNHAYERENLERLFAKIQRRAQPPSSDSSTSASLSPPNTEMGIFKYQGYKSHTL
ncbi:hypothetical protein [Mesorhizobium sp. M2A.F.Ca.ET.042.01.1.1]|uniref:hypothetical protein n=1 Tax=Mesorhizobium sp. M2A.F.Ca.ET.042.01.1.1 TaxID=2496745 RepID=UPI00167B1371|nr:hypothetical protein [Mesorhizobium sp. M2A.F.Ca.ET.042.01.1.1]